MKRQWTIGRKLQLSFWALAAITLVLGAVGYFGATYSAQSIDTLANNSLPGVQAMLEIQREAEAVKTAQRTLLNPDADVATRQRQYDNTASARERYEKSWERFESLEHSDQVDQLWGSFETAWDAWRAENNKFFEACRALDENEILNPTALRRDIEQFRGDHYALEAKVLKMLHDEQTFDGGEDPTQCRFGKWLATFDASNPQLRSILASIREPHDNFHHAVATIKTQLTSDGVDTALQTFEGTMAPAAQSVFGDFDQLLTVAAEAEQLATTARELAMGSCLQTQRQAVDALKEVVAANLAASQQDSDAAALASQRTVLGTLTATIAGVLVAIALGFLITRSINSRLSRISSAIDEGALQVDDAARQVATASQRLAEGASEQASSLEETSSSLEEMAAMTRTSSDNAGKAADLASQAQSAANGGEQVVGELNDTMAGINTASEKISKIIKVIEEIAFQTNLLALNAAVEAARAGEHGKGFAVVADEVRNLAMRAAEAARETTGLIEDAVRRAADGARVSEEVGRALSGIVGNVTEMTSLINGIAQAAREQSEGVDQINTAVGQMDKVTQATAAGAEESASAAEELSSQSATLRATVADLVAMVSGARDAATHHHPSPQPAKPQPTPGRPQQRQPQYAPAHDFTPPAHGADDSQGDDSLSSF